MKKERKEKLAEKATKDQIAEMTALCEDYRESMKRLKENRCILKRLQKRNQDSLSDFEVELIKRDIARTEKAIQQDDENTSYIRWAIGNLDERTGSIMTQLYVKGYRWEDVQDLDGGSITPGTLGRIRDQGLAEMAVLVSWIKKEIRTGETE